jgi:hypothetical protein
MEKFYIECDLKDMYPNKVFIRAHLDKELVRIGELPSLEIKNLCEHPLYPALVRYVQANPVPKVKA